MPPVKREAAEAAAELGGAAGPRCNGPPRPSSTRTGPSPGYPRKASKHPRRRQAAGARAIDVRPEAHARYNEWITDARSRFSWGVDSCNSYYRTPTGQTPFLFPGDIKTFVRQRDDMSLADFHVV